MKNRLLLKYLYADTNNFTSLGGIRVRKTISPLLRKLLILATKEKIVIEKYPGLEKKKPYIFVASHGFTNDSIASLASIDRNCYLLIGSTNQVEYNPLMNFAWLNGFIYVNRMDQSSRSTAVDKMEFIINNGSSVLMFPEGGFNNTENRIINRLFAGPYYLARRTGAEIVPIAPFYEYGSDTIYMNFGEPLNLSDFSDKETAIQILEETLSSMVWSNIEKHASKIVRSEMKGDIRLAFMEERRQEYLKNPWTRDVWEEELTVYKDRNNPSPQDVNKEFERVKPTIKNFNLVMPFIKNAMEDKKYDFKEYMHHNWMKK